MGKAGGERGGVMNSGPSRTAEAIAAIFVPPACREEVLGDLHERYSFLGQYGLDAVRTIPLVILSRIRRTADPQVLLMQNFAWYAAFLGAAWLKDKTFLTEQWGLMRLAFPAAMATLGLILEDAYATPGRRSPLQLARGPVLGVGLALASQGMFRITNPDLALPTWVTFCGCALSLVLSCAVRMLFPPATDQLQGANVPADWLNQSSGRLGNGGAITRSVKGGAAVIAVVIGGGLMADYAGLPKARIVALVFVVFIACQVWKRG
jgi:hypothetical protein